MSSPWRVRNSSALGRQRPVEHDAAGRPGAAPPTPRAATDGRVVELVERVLEVGQVVLAGLPGLVDLGLADLDPVGQPGRGDLGPRAGDRVRLEFDADELERREPPGHRDEPAAAAAVDVDDAAAARQVGDELRQRRERLLEEDRDVLRGQALDRRRGSGRAASRIGSPVRKKSTIPPQSSEATVGVDELAAEVLGAVLVEQDRRRRPRRSSGGRPRA